MVEGEGEAEAMVSGGSSSSSSSSREHTREVELQVAFQVRQQPGSFGIGQETIGATEKGEVIDPLIGNEQLEYYTQQSVGIILHGLLVKGPDFTATVSSMPIRVRKHRCV